MTQTIVVNPNIKLEWLKEQWEAEDIGNAREWILQAVRFFFSHLTDVIIFGVQMTSFRTSIRVSQAQQELSTPSTSQHELTNSTAISSRSLSAGYGRMNKLNVTVRRSASIPTTSATPLTPTIIVSEPTTAPETVQELIRKELEQDRKDAECEFSRYEDAGLLPDMAERTTDIVRFWEVCHIIFFH